MKSIYLTGFMGVGKTTIGIELAKKLDIPSFDTDAYVVKKTGSSITTIFKEHGEPYFRNLEEKALKDMPTKDALIMTGGGIVKSASNLSWMNEHGLVVFLYADIDVILARLENDTTRPLVKNNNKEQLKILYAERLPLYNQAHITLDTTNLPIDETVETLHKMIRLFS